MIFFLYLGHFFFQFLPRYRSASFTDLFPIVTIFFQDFFLFSVASCLAFPVFYLFISYLVFSSFPPLFFLKFFLTLFHQIHFHCIVTHFLSSCFHFLPCFYSFALFLCFRETLSPFLCSSSFISQQPFLFPSFFSLAHPSYLCNRLTWLVSLFFSFISNVFSVFLTLLPFFSKLIPFPSISFITLFFFTKYSIISFYFFVYLPTLPTTTFFFFIFLPLTIFPSF